ncbi:MAG: class I SAM-dependent methyltransferase [Proteobacteria bacterium]|nr:class I SAM-dependent methyltransferase [Pseudomonadota bacterium]
MKTLRLRAGKERSLLRRHPWIFDSAIAKGGGDAGETVRVEADDGRFLCWAAFSPASKIRARAWSFREDERIDAAFFRQRIAQAVQARQLFALPSDGVRLVHGEADGLPGLIVDRYGNVLVAQFLSAGVERWKKVLVDALLAETGLVHFYERSDASGREREGLAPVTGWLAGGQGQGTELTIQENGWKLTLDVATGHKTGFYLDQRDSRRRFSELAQQRRFRRVLNCYCYTGGFTVAALWGLRAAGALEDAQVVSVDSSLPALERARAHVELNGFEGADCQFLDADVNATLRRFIEQGQAFDAIVLDPPKFAPTVAHAERAARAYKDINRLGLKLLAPGGVLLTFSCSGGIGAELFHKIVASAGIDAGVDGYISERLGGAPDHPMTIEFPEGEYLKGLTVVRKKA